MRIISGIHKGRRIIAPKKESTRPTTDRSKEALFNILNNIYTWEDSSVLDLFAGTGNISYEFASRGVEKIVTVEINKGCAKFIDQTAKKLNINLKLINMDVFKFLKKTDSSFDIIFADPPYNLPLNNFQEIIDLIFKNNFIKEKGLLIIEHSKHYNFLDYPRWSHSKKYGNNSFSFFKK
tara:strand:- start:404 stop:940 length:537 start_codon:yes stop_codon:yes gene_type:complete